MEDELALVHARDFNRETTARLAGVGPGDKLGAIGSAIIVRISLGSADREIRQLRGIEMSATPLAPGGISARGATGGRGLHPGTLLAKAVVMRGIVREHKRIASTIRGRVVPLVAIRKGQ